jgi:hypothetical protein
VAGNGGAQAQYWMRVHTGDRPGARLGSSVAHVEVLGTEGVVTLALPRGPRSFERGSTDRFKLDCAAGLGSIVGIKVWHEAPGLLALPAVGTAALWHLEMVELENLVSGACVCG